MNVLDNHRKAKLEKLLNKMKYSQSNLALAMEYLFSEQADDSLLENADPQNFRLLGWASYYEITPAVTDLKKSGDSRLLERFYKLNWAVGRTSAVFVLEGRGPRVGDRSRAVEYLGMEAVAAMEAERLAAQNYVDAEIAWLHQLAQAEPEVLVRAQSLGSRDMQLVTAGILLHCAPVGSGLFLAQTQLLIECALEKLDDAIPQLSPQDRALLKAYILDGDPDAPLPALSSSVQYGNDPVSALLTKRSQDYSSGLLGGAAFLAAAGEPRARCILRLFLALNTRAVFDAIAKGMPWSVLRAGLDDLVEDMPGGKTTMLLLVSDYHWLSPERRRAIAVNCLDGLEEAKSLAGINETNGLYSLLPEVFFNANTDPKLEIANTLAKYANAGRAELYTYLTDSGSLSDTAHRLKDTEASSWNYPIKPAQMILERRKVLGWDEFTCRCAAAIGLKMAGGALGVILKDDRTLPGENVTALAQAMLTHGLPVTDMMNTFGNTYEAIYNEAEKQTILDNVSLMVRKPEYIPQLCDAAKNGTVFTRQTAIAALEAMSAGSDEAKAGILCAMGDPSKQIREFLLSILPGHPEWAEDYCGVLKSKKSAQRLLAAQVLGKLGQSVRPALEEALAAEKSAKVADAIRAVLGSSPEEAAVSDVEDLAARVLKGNKKRKIQWLLDAPMPGLRSADGSPVSEDRRDAMLVSYCDLGRIGRSDTAAQLAQDVDPEDLKCLAVEAWEKWYNDGAQARNKWVMAFAAVFGGSAMTPRLSKAIHDWPQVGRGAIACDAVMALAMSSDPAALLLVDSISRKFKFRQVKAAAGAALEQAARELGITAEELADRVVPDLGFVDGKRVFDYGNRSFTVRLTPTLELQITNDAGKTVKNIPAPGKTDDPVKAPAAYEEFKSMKKQIRTTVSAQKARLEAALAALRCWDREAWEALFVRNPIMHQFAMSLVWGVYEDGKLTDTFRYMEDGTFNTVDEEEYTLPENAKIGLAHPVELDAETLESWKQQLEDYEITQSVTQLQRSVNRLEPGMEKARTLESWGGRMLNGLSLSGKLLAQGWYRGSVVDGGGFYTYYREDPTLGLGVELSFSGSFVGDENDTVTVYDAVFYKAGTVKRGSYIYEKPRDEDIFPLGQIPARYYSEIVLQLDKATASSTETDPDWKSKME